MLITPMVEHGISQMMRALGRRYVYYVNKTYRRTGTLWEGRYKSCLIDSDHYLLTCMRYIELNPVRANMVSHPGEYQWSSYRINAQGEESSVIENHPLYLALGSSLKARNMAYRELFRNHMSTEALHKIRDALNHELVLGRSYFKDKIEEMTKRQTRMGQPGRPRVEEEEAVYLVGY
jgi:putative transposase